MSHPIHCLKCKTKTGTNGFHVVSSGKRMRGVGTCSKCGCKKSQFMPGGAKRGAGWGSMLGGLADSIFG